MVLLSGEAFKMSVFSTLPSAPYEKRRHKRQPTADLHYTPVRLDGVLLQRLEFLCAFEGKDRSSVIRNLLREAADRHLRGIAGSPSPSPQTANDAA